MPGNYPKPQPYEVVIRCECRQGGAEFELMDKGGGVWAGTCPACGATYTVKVEVEG